jgi:hypothetical protein
MQSYFLIVKEFKQIKAFYNRCIQNFHFNIKYPKEDLLNVWFFFEIGSTRRI